MTGPSLGILRYGVSPTFPLPVRHPVAARGRVAPGGPYGFIGSCSACPDQVLYSLPGVTADAVRRHIKARHS